MIASSSLAAGVGRGHPESWVSPRMTDGNDLRGRKTALYRSLKPWYGKWKIQ